MTQLHRWLIRWINSPNRIDLWGCPTLRGCSADAWIQWFEHRPSPWPSRDPLTPPLRPTRPQPKSTHSSWIIHPLFIRFIHSRMIHSRSGCCCCLFHSSIHQPNSSFHGLIKKMSRRATHRLITSGRPLISWCHPLVTSSLPVQSMKRAKNQGHQDADVLWPGVDLTSINVELPPESHCGIIRHAESSGMMPSGLQWIQERQLRLKVLYIQSIMSFPSQRIVQWRPWIRTSLKIGWPSAKLQFSSAPNRRDPSMATRCGFIQVGLKCPINLVSFFQKIFYLFFLMRWFNLNHLVLNVTKPAWSIDGNSVRIERINAIRVAFKSPIKIKMWFN